MTLKRKPRARSSASAAPELHALESEVMDAIWARESATVREVLDELNAGSKQRAYTTIMTIMSRLQKKGVLSRKRVGKTDVYRAVLSRDQYRDARASLETEELVRELGDHALVHFARHVEQLDADRLEDLRRLARDGT